MKQKHTVSACWLSSRPASAPRKKQRCNCSVQEMFCPCVTPSNNWYEVNTALCSIHHLQGKTCTGADTEWPSARKTEAATVYGERSSSVWATYSLSLLIHTAKSMGPVSELLSWFRGWGQLFSLKGWPWIGLYSFIPQQVLLWLSSLGSDVAVLLAPYESSLSSHPTWSRVLSLEEKRKEKTPSLPWLILSYWFYLLSKFRTFCSDSLGPENIILTVN